ncbi:MAG: DUF433 domain-containing protein [Phycisphaerales bacterium]
MSAIESKPGILGGTPCFAGTRVPVVSFLDALRHGRTMDEFLQHFPTVGREQVQAVLEMIKRGEPITNPSTPRDEAAA